MSLLQAFAVFMLGAASGAALIFVLLKPAVDEAYKHYYRAVTAPDDLVRECVSIVKTLARARIPNYELPADSIIEGAVWRIIARVQESQR